MIKRRKYEAGKILLEVSRIVNSSMSPDEVSKFSMRSPQIDHTRKTILKRGILQNTG